EQNYRSTQIILDVAKAVIQKNPNRVHKELFTERVGGEKLVIEEAYSDLDEAQKVISSIHRLMLAGYNPGDFAVMYRTNAQSRVLEEAFVRDGMPYKLVGATNFYGRREIKDVLAYLRVVHNPADEIGLNRIVNVPKRGIGGKTWESLRDWGLSMGWQPGFLRR
ncbi:MAG: ATP-dependent DNA helicase Rep, partial [Anaerolineales bacterium]|nr:ATP-dependent DNA helicase Rep [Anaerolineales bacterium]